MARVCQWVGHMVRRTLPRRGLGGIQETDLQFLGSFLQALIEKPPAFAHQQSHFVRLEFEENE